MLPKVQHIELPHHVTLVIQSTSNKADRKKLSSSQKRGEPKENQLKPVCRLQTDDVYE